MNTKVILIPGNGGGSPTDNWSPYLEKEIPLQLGISVINTQFPDALLARKEFWLPFIKELGADEDTILIGHSSGAIAAMRYAEENVILGSVLVGAYYTHMNYEEEKASQYFDTPWNWNAIKKNQQWTILFASTDDPFIPIEEPRHIRDMLGSVYHEHTDRAHFGHGTFPQTEFPELIEALRLQLISE
ncbi:alpha/beta hydrolase [Patescibacteria group bacterium]|nr:alpha/beta hydrolase [Patescibacteria group bacterium]